jgi:hypothetical protein
MDVAKDGWYTELGPMWPGQGLSLKVKEVLHRSRSKFQASLAAPGFAPAQRSQRFGAL